MREMFHERLDELVDRLSRLLSTVGEALRNATNALLYADDRLAGQVIDGDRDVVAQRSALDELALDLLARQQPVATDLRTVVACLRVSVDIRRMGKLAVHLAEIARRYHPGIAVTGELRPVTLAMSAQVQQIVAAAGLALATRDGSAAAELEHDDDRIDELQEDLHRRLFDRPAPVDVEHAVDGGVDRPLLRTVRRPRGVHCPTCRVPDRPRRAGRAEARVVRPVRDRAVPQCPNRRRHPMPRTSLLFLSVATVVLVLGTGCASELTGTPVAGGTVTTASGTTPESPAPSDTRVPTTKPRPPETAPPTSSRKPVPLRTCRTGDLRTTLGASEGAAGTMYRALVFTNVSSQPCTMRGYPAVAFLAADDWRQVGEAAVPTGPLGAAARLAPGQQAAATLGIVNTGNFDPETCQPVPVRGLVVSPPHATAAVLVPLDTTACTGALPGSQLSIRSVHKGANLE